MGEYERSSTTVLNAYVGPRSLSYLRDLDRRLAMLGLPNRMLLIQNNSGAVSVDEIAARPVALLLSGPAAGVGAMRYYSCALGSDDLISMEIGGTSCDVMLMSHGAIAQTDRLEVDGYDVVSPSIDIQTIGAGGGTIAGVDSAGLLFVGPQGAGARPGPACYGLGGTCSHRHRRAGRPRPPGAGNLRRRCRRHRRRPRPRGGAEPGRRIAPPEHRCSRHRHHSLARTKTAACGAAHQHRARPRPAPLYADRRWRCRCAARRQRGPRAGLPAGLCATPGRGVLRARHAETQRLATIFCACISANSIARTRWQSHAISNACRPPPWRHWRARDSRPMA